MGLEVAEDDDSDPRVEALITVVVTALGIIARRNPELWEELRLELAAEVEASARREAEETVCLALLVEMVKHEVGDI